MNKSEKLKTCTCVSLLSKSTLKLEYARYIKGLQFKVLDWMAPCWHFLEFKVLFVRFTISLKFSLPYGIINHQNSDLKELFLFFINIMIFKS